MGRDQSPLIASREPVDLDWDFTEGVLNIVAQEGTVLRLSLATEDGIELDGQPVMCESAGERLHAIDVPAGRHRLTGAAPAPGRLALLAATLRERVEPALRERAENGDRAAPPAVTSTEPMARTLAADVGGAVADIEVIYTGGEVLVAAASGDVAVVLDAGGDAVRHLKADADIRVMRWWPEAGLLLVGCVDDRVIAYDLDGQRRWDFSSEMDPEFAASGKSWWFKSSGHEGIFGLHTGVFLDGESQCFVGSASTLEIIDHEGALIERLPMYWGDVRQFTLIDDPEGGRSLLAARWPNGFDTLAILSNQTLDPSPRGFRGVPEGHTFINGWTAMNRVRTLYKDLDGDGTREVVSGINGTWNRVTVWSADGTALHNAHSVPALRASARTCPTWTSRTSTLTGGSRSWWRSPKASSLRLTMSVVSCGPVRLLERRPFCGA
ncbi:MAG: hypothetical protein U9R79_09045 [Armatimonadota bacterium]|nr:hypothetical protein [Armatimonadota bacterium]